MLAAAPDKDPKLNGQVESTIRENEERLRQATVTGRLISWERDINTGQIKISEGAGDVIGFEVPQDNIKHVMHVHPDDAERVEKAMQHAIATKEPLMIEHRLAGARKDQPIWVRVIARLVDDHRLIGITRNIDAEKKARAALIESETNLANELADMQLLQEVSHSLIEEEDSGALYKKILEAASTVMHSDTASIQMLIPERNELFLLAHKGFAPASAKQWEWVSVEEKTSCGLALLLGERVLIPDVEEWKGITIKDLEAYRLSGIHTTQSTRLISRSGSIVGMISTHWRKVYYPSEKEFQLFDILARQVADLIERKNAEEKLRERQAWLNGQKQAFQAAMSGQSLAASLHPLIDTIITQTNGEARAAFYMVPADKEGLHLVAGMPEGYARDVNGFKVGPESLVCGLAMDTGEPVITPDVELEPLWTPFLSMARKHNYRSCWSFPVYTEGGPVLGTFAMYFEQPRNPSQREMELAGILAHAAAVIISRYNETVERTCAEEALRKSEQRLKEFNNTLEQQVKERTSELQENHKLLESIYNTTHVGMSVFKPIYNRKKQITDFKIIIVNKRIEDSSGRKDLPGKLYSKVFPGIKKMGLFDAMVNAMETGERVHMEYFYEHEGINRWYATMFIRNGDMLVSSNMDMTEQKRVEERNRELDRRQKELEEMQQQEIFRTVLDTQEIERKRIAETLHNSLGQILYAAKLSLGTVDKSQINESNKESIKTADKLLTDAITESRRLSHELMPVILEDFGLKTSIEDVCRRLSGKVQFKCRFKGSAKRLDKYIEVAIYRLIQELMMNVVRHSEASNSLVAIEAYHNRILVLVQDDGKGFNALKEKAGGIGLKTIRNNVNLLNGNIDIISKAGKGTIINIDIPFKADK
ncbi:MAG TPA: GAF domain-containing protein [Mucilaginibacter sp.]